MPWPLSFARKVYFFFLSWQNKSIEAESNLFLKGYKVVTTLLAHEPCEHLTDNGIHAFTADVTKDLDIERLCNDVSNLSPGGLDVLVNNA